MWRSAVSWDPVWLWESQQETLLCSSRERGRGDLALAHPDPQSVLEFLPPKSPAPMAWGLGPAL